MELTQAKLDSATPILGQALQKAIEEAGLGGYQLESIKLKTKADAQVLGLLPGCELKCELDSGIPPSLKCEVKCG